MPDAIELGANILNNIRHSAIIEIERELIRKDTRISALEAENRRLREALVRAASLVQQIAFRMPPPNEYTPELIMVAQSMEQIARAALSQEEICDPLSGKGASKGFSGTTMDPRAPNKALASHGSEPHTRPVRQEEKPCG